MSTTAKRKLNVCNTAIRSIEKLVTEFEELKVSPEKNERIIAIRDTINDKLLKIRELNDEIMDKIEEEFIEEEDDKTTSFSIFVKERMRDINKFLSEETVTVTSSVARASVRLPKLDLKKFDGKPENWGEFWDTFTHAVHENESISEVQKMTYLKTLVAGTAAQTITGFKITSDNYNSAVQLLKERYENKHLQISLHMNNLLEIQPIKQMRHVEELRKLYNTIETQMRILKNLDIDDSMYGPFLVPVLQRKVPTELNLIFSRHFHSRDSWDIKELLEQFKIELMAREKSSRFPIEEDIEPFTASSLTAHNNDKERKLQCVFCEQPHRPQHCKVITDVKARKAVLKEKGRCFRCLRSGHLSSKCSTRIKCYTCQKSHHQSVCEGDQARAEQKDSTHSIVASSTSSTSVLLQTAKVDVLGENNTSSARILFDGGSQLSYISKDLRRRLNLETIERKEIYIKAFGTISTKESLEKVSVKIKTIDGTLENVYCFVKDICHPITAQNTTLTLNKYSHLRKLRLADPNEGESEIDLLIGSDYYWNFISNEVIRGDLPNAPVAIKSKLGFILSGPTSVTNQARSSSTMTSHVLKCETEVIDPDTTLSEHLDRFWTLETFEPDNDSCNELNIRKDFCDNLTFDWEQGKYRVSLPFKNDHDLLPDNYSNCSKRLKGLHRRFSNDAELLQNYHGIIEHQLESGVIEPVPESEIKPPGQVHYLPHRPVVRNDKSTTKILLSTDDKDFVRFLWYKQCPDYSNGSDISTPIQIYRLCRVLFGVNSSPFLLSATLIEHFKQLPDKQFVEKVLKSLHVDDLISGGDTETEASQLYKDTKDHLSIASFNLRKFQSNSDKLNIQIHGNEHSCESMSKVLGLSWNMSDDEFLFCFDYLYEIAVDIPSKRQLLSFMASIYDPLGLLNPFVVKLKILFQKTCLLKIAWDCKLHGELLKDWRSIRDDFLNCEVIKFDRWVHTLRDAEKIEVHGFSDASLKAYGACVYLKVYVHGQAFVSLLTAKSRVAPTKSTTIPKLELMGALLLANLVGRVLKELSYSVQVHSCFCWVDSMVALHWICDTSKSYQAFVKRRVDQIRSIVPSDHWFHVDTKSNPADILSRGVSLSHLVTENLWRYGPPYLRSLKNYDEFSLKNKLSESSTTLTTAAVEEEEAPDPVLLVSSVNLFQAVDINRFNKLDKLVRVVAYVHRFITNIKQRKNNLPLMLSCLSVSELRNSTSLLVRSCQRDVPADKSLKQLQQNLRLYTDENNLIRCRGRLENADLPYDAKFPLFIPKCQFTVLIVRAAHEKVKHNGLKETINELRTCYWIPQVRTFAKSIIHKCVLCKILESQPYSYPASPALPTSRVSISPPFTHSAIDYAGPVYVKSIHASSSIFKAWIVLYTCHATRAICLDLVPSYDADTCIRTLRRFCSRRGVPSTMLSDNGSNFTAHETQQFASNHGITWTFNPPASPWWGGMFERLIRSTKRCLKKILLRAKLDYEELLTVLYEVETVINNRPLTFTYENPGDDVVTPNHLIFGRRLNLQATADAEKPDVDPSSGQRLRYVNTLLQSFWSRWKNEYLTELREHHRLGKDRDNQCDVGDVVLIREENRPRISFRTGIIESLKPSRDNMVRAATVRYRKNNCTLRVTRPVNKLYPIECKEKDTVNKLYPIECKEKDTVNITFVSDNEIAEVF